MYPGSKSLRGQNHYPLLLLLSSSTNHPFLSALSAGRTNHGKCESVSHSVLFLCNPTNCSPPGSSVHGILQARISEWVAIPFSRGSSQIKDQTWVSCIVGRFFTSEPPGKPIINSIYAFIKTHSNTIKMFKLVNEMSLRVYLPRQS